MPAVEIDSEEAAAFEEEEEPQHTPTPPVSPTAVRRRATKRTTGRALVEDSEEEVQSGAGEEDQPTIIPPTHPISIKRTWVLGGHFSRYCLRKVVCGCFLCREDEVLKAELERRRSYSIPGKICGMMRMLRHSGQNLGALGEKNGEKDKRERVQPTPTRDHV
ncbi:hypothetical protein V6N11_043275 [Hibiscus sabdariffa]|uniref:Uncharacterized protein n=1 Tax=Hibiscus sabdariffa TaxID=183260 RepID=A0ABR2QZ95_9ROSI